MKKIKDSSLQSLLEVFLGMLLLAFAISAILKPNNLVTGGITGISIIFEKLVGLDYTIGYYILSLGVLLATHLFLGWQESSKIIILSILFPIVLMVFNQFNFNLTHDDLFLASIYYGVIGGIGTGLILKSGYSSGGTDSIGKIIHKRFYPFISINLIMTIIDLSIVVVSMFVYDLRIALYAIITRIVFLKSTDTAIYGFGNKLMKLEIISDNSVEIENYILHDIKRGVSKYEIVGGYSKKSKIKLVTICSPRESMLIKTFIANCDRSAFVAALPVSSVWGVGVGFRRIEEDEY